MPLAIRDYKTGNYFAQGNWIPDPSMADNFTGEDAINKAVADHKIASAEMVILDVKKRFVAGVRLDGSSGNA